MMTTPMMLVVVTEIEMIMVIKRGNMEEVVPGILMKTMMIMMFRMNKRMRLMGFTYSHIS